MKTILRLLLVFAFSGIQIFSISQSFTNSGVPLTGIHNGSVDWGDFDNDGDLDLLISGDTSAYIPRTRLYRNDGNNQFTPFQTGFVNIFEGDADWGDYDNDGDLDLLLYGNSDSLAFADEYVTKLYRNNGNSSFTDVNINITNRDIGAISWMDFDNDGHPDIVTMAKLPSASNAIIRFFRNNGNNAFVETGFTLPGNNSGVMKCGDMNNDGRCDIVTSGSSGWTFVYFNNGDNTFTPFSQIAYYYFPDLDLGDFDSDGNLDFVIAGRPAYGWEEKTNVYRNDGNSAFSEVLTNITGVGVNPGVSWADYDNDGDQDFILAGKTHSDARYTKIVRNDGNSNFSEIDYGFSPVFGAEVAWGDQDNDFDLDLAIISGDIAKIYQSSGFTYNSAPNAPANLNATIGADQVTLSWSQANDLQTPSSGLSYNLRIGTTPGGIDVMSPMSRIADGKRLIQKLGNVYQNTDWTIKNLTHGTYYWSVQAVDGAFAGSPFATEQSFTIGPALTIGVTTTPASNLGLNQATLNGLVQTDDHTALAGFILKIGNDWESLPATPSTVPANEAIVIICDLSNLSPATSYLFVAWASVTIGANPPVYYYGDTLSFTTLDFSVPITGDTATNISFYSAKLCGTINPSGLPTAISFELGTDASYGYVIEAIPDSISGSSPVAIVANLTGIAAETTFHFRVKTESTLGIFYGDDRTFTTLPYPVNNFTFKPERTINQVGAYTDLEDNGSVILVENYDDNNSDPIDIGFDFIFAEATFSQFVLNTNGFIKLGDVSPSDSVQFFNAPRGLAGDLEGLFCSPHFADVFLISPFNHDLIAGTNPPEFRVLTEGDSGKRVCTIQFKNLQEKIEPPDHQFDNIDFQIKLHENNSIEFVYGNWTPSITPSAWRTSAVGLKGANSDDEQLLTITKSSNASWESITVQSGNYCNTCYPFNYGNPSRPIPEPGLTYSFYPKLKHDAEVCEVYTLGKLPIPIGLPHSVSTCIKNTGYDTLTNIPVHLEITGENQFSGFDTIPLLKPDSAIIVKFPGFNPSILGYNTVNINIPEDDYVYDNSKDFVQEITVNEFNYCDTVQYDWSWGFFWVPGPGSSPGLWLNKYHITGSKNIVAANIGLGWGDGGQEVYAVVLNSSKQIVAQSGTVQLTLENSMKYHRFDFLNSVVIPEGDFYVGLVQTESPLDYWPMGAQEESPNRPDAYFMSGVDGTGMYEEIGGNSRFCIEAIMDSGYCKPNFGYVCSDPYYGQFINNFFTTGGNTNISNLNSSCSNNSNNYTSYPDQIVSAEQGTSFNFQAEGSFSWNSRLDLWADWNNDGDFYDTLEMVHQGVYSIPGKFIGKINIPTTAIPGNTTLRVVLHDAYNASNPCGSYSSGETEDYTLMVLNANPMMYQAGTTFQCDTHAQISRGTVDNPIIGVKIDVTGVLDPLVVTSFNLSAFGTSDFENDVTAIKVYYSGNDSVFSTNQLFGYSVDPDNPLSGNAVLSYGTNYFWVTYDISESAVVGNYLDATCLDYSITGTGTQIPSIISPPGKLTINYCIPGFSYPGGCEWGVGINSFSTSGGITNISNLDNGCPGNAYDYTFFTNQKVTAEQGAPFLFNLTSTGNDPNFSMYVDWNQDYDFDDSGEKVYDYWMPISDTITVPGNSVPGTTRLRVIAYWQEQKGNTSPLSVPGCPWFDYGAGETEDYWIEVLPSQVISQSINIPSGWSGFSTYVEPQTYDIAEMLAPINEQLIIISDFNQVYWPGENLNTFIDGWHSSYGAQIKLSSPAPLTIEGNFLTRQVMLNPGWNYLPVLSECPVDVADWFSPIQTHVKVAKDIAGTGVYWPEYNINTLSALNPGKAYFINWDIALSLPVEYPTCEKGQGIYPSTSSQTPVSPWNEPAMNPGSHLVAFPEDVTRNFLETGDMIGSFTTGGFCSGVSVYEEYDFAQVIFGDDPFTSEKDGFSDGETMTFKMFRPSTAELFDLEAAFQTGENQCNWVENGLSVVKSFKLSPASHENQHKGIIIFPNPGNGLFKIYGLTSPAKISIMSIEGEIVFIKQNFTDGQIDLSDYAPGLYVVNILNTAQSLNFKLVIE